MRRSEFARAIVERKSSELDIAATFVWYRLAYEGVPRTTLAEITDFFRSEAISQPNASRLKGRLASDRRLLSAGGGYTIRRSAMPGFEAAFPQAVAVELPSTPAVFALSAHAKRLSNEQSKSFVLEAIECVKAGCYRAAVVMSWCGAVSLLQDYIFESHLAAFNADAVANNLIRKPAVSLADMRGINKESQFLECLARISILDDSMKRGLKRCLDRRNDCGHPSDLKIGEAAVADHLETLMLNVFERF
jgi:hypothetical protein